MYIYIDRVTIVEIMTIINYYICNMDINIVGLLHPGGELEKATLANPAAPTTLPHEMPWAKVEDLASAGAWDGTGQGSVGDIYICI